MKSLRMVVLGALSALLFMGCNDKSSKKDGPLNLDTFAAAAADTVCNALVTCSCTDASALADCKTAYKEVVTVALSAGSVILPGVKLDPTAAQACLDDLKAEVQGCPSPTWWEYSPTVGLKAAVQAGGATAASRAMPVTLLESCMAAVVGTQTTDEHCGNPLACGAGLSCDPRTMTCAAQAAVDQSCAFVGCADGLLCDSSEICVAIPGLDDACPDDECQRGLFCDQADHLCKNPIALDGACAGDDQCVSGAYCDVTCKAFLADGVACTSSSECLHGWCNDVGTMEPKCDDPGFCSVFDMFLQIL